MYKYLLAGILFLLSGGIYAQHTLLDARDFRRLQADSSFTIVDLRTQLEYELVGHIPGSVSFNCLKKNFTSDLISQYPISTPLMIYCLSGHRSSEAAMQLLNIGYTRVYELKGGLIAWMSHGYSLE